MRRPSIHGIAMSLSIIAMVLARRHGPLLPADGPVGSAHNSWTPAPRSAPRSMIWTPCSGSQTWRCRYSETGAASISSRATRCGGSGWRTRRP